MATSLGRVGTVLLLHGDDLIRESLVECLESLSPVPWVLKASGSIQANLKLAEHQIDLVIADLEWPSLEGVFFLARLANRRPRIPAILLAPREDLELAVRLRDFGVCHVFGRPVDCTRLRRAVAQQLRSSMDPMGGFCLPAMLLLIESEKKSCSVRLTKTVLDSELEGALYFENGRLMDAAAEDLCGESAVRELMSWRDPLIEIEKALPLAETRIRAPISDFLKNPSELSEPLGIDPRIIKAGSREETGLAEAMHHLPGVVAVALFSWPEIKLLAAVASDEDEPLPLVASGATEVFRVLHQLEKVYGENEHESLFWFGSRFLLLHSVGAEHCAVIAADPEVTTAQLLRRQLRNIHPGETARPEP